MHPETIQLDSNLPYKERKAISQALANLALSGMRPSEESIRNIEAVVRGEKTHEQLIQELTAKYMKNPEEKYPVGRGWWPLANEAADRLGQMGIQIESIYEKYGSLQFYVGNETDEATAILLEIEERSRHTCEHCGKPGGEVERNGYVKTLCPACAEIWDGDFHSI